MTPIPLEQAFLGGMILYAAAAVFGLAAARHRRLVRTVVFGLSSLGAVLEILASVAAIGNPQQSDISVPVQSFFVQYTFRLDPLSGYFSLALAVVGLAVSIYSFGYVRGFNSRKSPGVFSFFYCILLLSLTAVFAAANAVVFLIAWEVMALSAYFLVSFDHENPETRQAGVLFFIMSHAGTGALLIAFLLFGTWAGDFDFSALHLRGPMLSPDRQAVLFLLFFIGFGVKAGMIPVHVWLPAAHPAAPSNVSALMSAILIKTGIYGILRVVFGFLGILPLWCGMLVAIAGTASALVGVLYALIEPDIKRMLAYSTIENVGIILMAVGAGMIFQSYDHPALAALALIAGLYHMFNHAVFKSLLFLSAGAAAHAAETRNLEEMGGLIRRMPVTAACFLVGAIAISGLPPLNGFVSEWLTYQTLLAGFGSTISLTRVLFPIAGSLLALTGALAAACFVRAFGIGFLALPRSPHAGKAHEAPASMLLGMGALAALCLFLGVGATLWLPMLDPVSDQLIGMKMSGNLIVANGISLSSGSPKGGTISLVVMAGALMGFGLLLPLILAAFRRGRTGRLAGPTWDCGLPGLTEANEYTATAFSKALRMIFAAFFQPRREIQTEFEVSAYYPTAIRFESEVEPPLERHVYSPLKDRIMARASRLQTIQAGSIHAYLTYIFITLVVLLLFGVRS